ncbi:MAG: hypothetical protein KBT00_04175 [Bacteroidales bacterium]|nr:hypothetical protein [Candidatus Cacconaster merdequi]
MDIPKKSFVFFLALAFVAGFGLHFLVGNVLVENSQSGSDISKANRYIKSKSNVELNILQSRLQNDEEYFNQTKEVSSLLLSRVNSLADLTERSIELCSGIEELSGQVSVLESLNAKAGNTGLALEDVCNGLDMMADGKVVSDYEQAYNNAIAGFFRIEKQMGFGKSFVETAGNYMKDNENTSLAALVSEWAAFSYQDAAINKSESDMAYWKEKYRDMSKDAAVEVLDAELLSSLDVSLDGMDEWSLTSFMDMLQILNLDGFSPWGGYSGAQGSPDDSTGTVNGGGSTGPDGNNWHIHIN